MFSATVGHPQVTKIYEEKIYSIRILVVVHILSVQRDLVLRLSILKLIIYSTGKVDREESIYTYIHVVSDVL